MVRRGGHRSGSSNAYNLGSLGAVVTVSNGAITVGAAGAGFNMMTVTNAQLWSGALTVGNGGSNNTVTVLSNATWNMLGTAGTVGSGSATGNVLVVNGGVMTNVNGITLGANASFGNTLTINSNGAKFFYGGEQPNVGSLAGSSNNVANIGGPGAPSIVYGTERLFIGANASGNSMTVTNAQMTLADFNNQGLFLGYSSTAPPANSNTLTVLAGGVIDMVNRYIWIGGGGSAATGQRDGDQRRHRHQCQQWGVRRWWQ